MAFPATTDADSPAQSEERSIEILRVVQECLLRRASDPSISDESIINLYPGLMPELGRELAKLRVIAAARQQAVMADESGQGSDQSSATDQATDQSTDQTSQIRVRCPECFVSTTVDAGSAWEDITCSGCGKHFSMIGDDLAGGGIRAGGCVGHFELIEQVGFGAFGTVWKARDTDLDRLVAIKIPRRGQFDAAETEQFLREARAAAQLRHSNIVGVHEVGRLDDRVYIVSDLIEGDSLAETIADQRMSACEAAALCRDIALALDHAHAAGVVHRDLKPANILLDRDGQPHLTDFGLARRSAAETTVTHDGQLVGTPAYMSPEQASGQSHQADQRSDVYSLGVILYELLTGELPFRGNVRMVVQQILADDAASPRKLNPTVPRDLETITLKCLEKDPARRYVSAKELAGDLGRYLNGEPIHARPVNRAQRAWRWCRRNPRLAGLSATVAALLLIVAGMTTYSSIQSRAAAREARWQQYLSDMHVAMQAWEEGDLDRALEALDRNRPASGDEDLRNFEWYYLWAHVRAALAVPGFKLGSQVRALAVSPNGQLCAAGEENGGLSLWSLPDLRRVRVLTGTRFRTGTIDFTSDGELMATGSGDPAVAQIWDVASGKLLHTLKGHTQNLLSVAFSPDAQFLATSSADHTAKVWDVSTGIERCTLRGHEGQVVFVAWRDNETVITGSWDQTVREWNVTTRTQTPLIERVSLPGNNSTFALSPDQSLLAVGSSDGSIRLLNTRTGNLKESLPGHRDRVRAITFSTDGKMLASASSDHRAVVWDISTSKPRATIKAHSSALVCLAFTPDGSNLLTGSQDGSVKYSSIKELEAEDLVCRGHDDFVFNIAFDRTGERLVSASADGSVRVWNVTTGTGRILSQHSDRMHGIVCSPLDSTVVASGFDGKVTAWNGETGALLWTVQAHPEWAPSIDFSPDGEVVTSSGRDNMVRLWRAADGSPAGSFRRKDKTGFAVKFSPDRRLLAFNDRDSCLTLLDWRTGEEVHTFEGHRGGIGAIAFSQDGRLVAATDGTSTVMRDLASGRQITVVVRETVHSIAFSPDGSLLATADCGNRVHLWDVATGAERAVFDGHTGWVNRVVFSPDGTILASASDDRTIRLWRAAPAPLQADKNAP